MKYLPVVHTIILLLSISGVALADDLADADDSIKADLYNIVKKVPLVGCGLFCKVDDDDINFFWYSNNSIQNGSAIDEKNATLISKSRRTVFIIWGYFSNMGTEWVIDITAILLNKNYDVVVVDWTKWSKTGYIRSANAVKCIGVRVGGFIANLHQEYQYPLENFLLLGFSLGAHVSGFAGKEFIKQTGLKLPIIVGLDPAGPCFNPNSEDDRLSPDDADIVHVLHCNAFLFGINFACGTNDIWVNGGCSQPGCPDFSDGLQMTDIVGCSHVRCHDLFMAAIENPGQQLAQKCGPWTGCGSAKVKGDEKIDIADMETNQTGGFCIKTDAQ